MYRIKDFCLKKVYNTKMKKIGMVEDVYLDMKKNKLIGLKISDNAMFSKRNFVDINKTTLDKGKIFAIDGEKKEALCFKNIKNTEIYNEEGNLRGVMEDILIDDEFNITAVISSSGIIENIIEGKEILLFNNCEYNNKYIIYKGKDNISLKIMPHGLNKKYEG